MKIPIVCLSVLASACISKAATASVTVPATAGFVNSSLTVSAGDCVSITSTGSWKWGASSPSVGPNGAFYALDIPNTPMQNGMNGQLIGVIGTPGSDPYFAVGSSAYFRAVSSGDLLLGINDFVLNDNSGTVTSQVNVVSCYTAPSNIVAFWKGEDNAMDSVGGNNGAPLNISYSDGIVERAFRFSGTNSGIVVPPSKRLDVGTTTGFTIEGWIAPTAVANLNQWLFGWREGSDTYGACVKLSQAPSAGQGAGSICINIIDVNGTPHVLSTSPLIVDYAFHHLAVTYDSSGTGLAKIYVNGTLAAQSSFGSFTPQTSYPFVFGSAAANGNYGESDYRGYMDEVALYSRALSSNEIYGIFSAGCAGKCPPQLSAVSSLTNLVSLWKAEFNAEDSVGSNDGTATAISYVPGEVGESFWFTHTNIASGVIAPASSTLNVGLSSGFTIEAWVHPVDLDSANQWLFGWRYGSNTYGSMVKLSQDPEAGQGSGSICANIIDVYGNPYILSSGPIVLENAFQHIAVTYDSSGGVARIFRNGLVVAEESIGTIMPQTSYPFVIGVVASGGSYGEHGFAGRMDEVSLYNRALTVSEVQGVFNAGTAGKQLP